MKNNLYSITEQDLFRYVFYPEKVSPEQASAIESNTAFSEVINFYRELKENLHQPLSEEAEKKLFKKISAYNNVITLHAMTPGKENKNSIKHFAAASTQLKPAMIMKSYIDRNKEFLIKIINDGNITKIYVLSAKDTVLENFDLVVETTKKRYHFRDNNKPLVVEQKIDEDAILTLHFL